TSHRTPTLFPYTTLFRSSAARVDIRRAFGWGSLLLTARPGREIRTPSVRLMLDLTGFRASTWRTKGTGEIRSRAEPQANKFSPRSEEHTSELQSPDHLVC